MKKLLPLFVFIAALALLFLGYNYLESRYDVVTTPPLARAGIIAERAMYRKTENALMEWEKGRKKNESEAAFLDVLGNKTVRLAAENPYVTNMTENIDFTNSRLPKEAVFNKELKKLKSADAFVFYGRKYFAAYYRKAKDKSCKIFEEKEELGLLVETKIDGIPPAAQYGFKTIKFSKESTPVLVVMSFAGDDSWSSRNYYVMDKAGEFKNIYSYEGAWVEERYYDLNGDKQLELVLQRRLGYEPEGAKDILKKLKDNNLTGYNAIFYEYEIIMWDDKNAGLVRAGSVIKVDFSHKE